MVRELTFLSLTERQDMDSFVSFQQESLFSLQEAPWLSLLVSSSLLLMI